MTTAPRRRRLGDDECAGDDFRNAVGVLDGRDHLCHFTKHLRVVDFLERTATDLVTWHLADEKYQRHRVLLRNVYRDRCVGRARPAANEGNAGFMGEFGIGNRHQTGATLVPANHSLHGIALVECVEHGQITLTWNAKQAIDTVRAEAIDKEIGGAARHRQTPAVV